MMTFKNSYEDNAYAEAYDKLEFPGTYYLAFRDLPWILKRHAGGKKAMDFGCGTGRSTRFLARLGFEVMGVDIAEEMVQKAKANDDAGLYLHIKDGDLSSFEDDTFDVVLSTFTFDNIATAEKKIEIFSELCRVLKPDGRIVSLVSSPEIYWHEWSSFSTKDFPENRQAKCGEVVKIIVTALEDKRPVDDIIWPHINYLDVYNKSGLEVLEIQKPLGREDDPCAWVSETTVPPWVIYVLGKG